jgi:pyruvate dehydrogenase E2 component (dihydrolipoamide acetyltransferase)
VGYILRVPALGAAIANVTVVEWLADEGAELTLGQPLLEVETDKMNMEIPAERAGVLHRILAGVGTLTVEGRPLAVVGDAGEDVAKLVDDARAELGVEPAPAEEPAVAPRPDVVPAGRVLATPVARRVAGELGIDLAAVQAAANGAEPINEKDVRRFAASTAQHVALTPSPGGPEDIEVIKLIGARKVLADRMAESASTIPHFTMTFEIDCTQLIVARNALSAEYERKTGGRLSATPFLIRAIARAVRDQPIVNATLVGDEIRVRRTANVGVAVALDDLIVVPVVRDPADKSITEIGKELNRLIGLVRARKIGPDDAEGATITLSNVAGTQIVDAAPIINPPQVAIVATTRIVDRVVPIDGALGVRPFLNAIFAYDHRVVQGVPGARFAEQVKAHLENQLDG